MPTNITDLTLPWIVWKPTKNREVKTYTNVVKHDSCVLSEGGLLYLLGPNWSFVRLRRVAMVTRSNQLAPLFFSAYSGVGVMTCHDRGWSGKDGHRWRKPLPPTMTDMVMTWVDGLGWIAQNRCYRHLNRQVMWPVVSPINIVVFMFMLVCLCDRKSTWCEKTYHQPRCNYM